MDYSIFNWFNALAGQKTWLDVLGIICSDFLIFSVPLIIVLVYFFSRRREKIIPVLLKIIFAFILTCLINYALKGVVARPRPFVSHVGVYRLAKLFADLKDYSFPSNHTAAVFVMAIGVLFDWKKFGLILLIPATLVGLGRIFVGVHYPSDVLAGAAIALAISWLTLFLFRDFRLGRR